MKQSLQHCAACSWRFERVFVTGRVLSEDDGGQDAGPPLPGTMPLTDDGDIASELVAGADRFLLKQIDESAARRKSDWKRDFSSPLPTRPRSSQTESGYAHILGRQGPAGAARNEQ